MNKANFVGFLYFALGCLLLIHGGFIYENDLEIICSAILIVGSTILFAIGERK